MLEYVFENYIVILIGIVITILISLYAYHKKSLNKSGMISALVMGITITISGGYYFIAVLFTFFVSSSVLSKFHNGEKRDALRSYKQVLANGLVGTIISVIYLVTQEEVWIVLYTISFAASTADTWASEIGKLAKNGPRHILSFEKMKQGLSGGITGLGIIASLMGSVLISAFQLFQLQVIVWGFLGSVVDSLLGTIQVKYITEQGETLDEPTQAFVSTKGISWLTNNVVNFVSNLIVVLCAYFAILWLK